MSQSPSLISCSSSITTSPPASSSRDDSRSPIWTSSGTTVAVVSSWGWRAPECGKAAEYGGAARARGKNKPPARPSAENVLRSPTEGVHDAHRPQLSLVLQILGQQVVTPRHPGRRNDECIPPRALETILDRPGSFGDPLVERHGLPQQESAHIRAGRPDPVPAAAAASRPSSTRAGPGSRRARHAFAKALRAIA